MNEDTLRTIEQWRAEGQGVAVAQVIRTYSSAPRPTGSIFAVAGDGRMAGSVSGGCVEGAIVHEAKELFGEDHPRPRYLHYGISDDLAGTVGLACGGDVWVSLSLAADRPRVRRGAIVSAITGPQAGARLVFDADADEASGDLEGALRMAAVDAGRAAVSLEQSRSVDLGDDGLLFAEAVFPPHRLVIIGAVDTSEEVCRLAAQLGWRTVVIDPRARFATAERIPHADRIVVGWPGEAMEEIVLEPSDSVIALTHDPKIDDPALERALRTGTSYVGALGSQRTQATRRERLIELGLAPEAVQRIYGPIGLDLGARTPAGLAVSIVSEVIAHRAGKKLVVAPPSD